jgi:uncharacterized membrane protein YeaQ/YmgE (transglycosylase-associated protein family)
MLIFNLLCTLTGFAAPDQALRKRLTGIQPPLYDGDDKVLWSKCNAPLRYTRFRHTPTSSKGTTMGILWTIVLGFVIGVVAKLLHPGKENMGFLMTIGLGVAGSLLAGVIGQFIGWYQAGEGAGFIASVIVSIILLVIYGRIRQGSTPPQ